MQHTRAAARARRIQKRTTAKNVRVKEKQTAICVTKHRYTHSATAEAEAQRLRLRTYRCPICRGWHLTQQL